MKKLEETGVLKKLQCGTNVSYLLLHEDEFLLTEYKVLQSQSNHGFLKCMKMMYNGNIQLYYLSSEYKTLQELLPSLTSDHLLTIIGNLFSTILEAKNNGFLSCQNIDICMENIYVDITTYQVYLIYLPLNTKLYEDYASFENELRTSFIRTTQRMPYAIDSKVSKLLEDLSDGMLTLEQIERWLRGGKHQLPPLQHVNAQPSSSTVNVSAKLIAMNAPGHVELNIDKDEYKLGKSLTLVDGVLSFNKMISRVHCKICKQGGQYFLVDLHSANGTYINRIKLLPDQPHPIKDGDVIRLANSDFQVVIR